MGGGILGWIQAAGAAHAALFGMLLAGCGSPADESGAKSRSGQLCGGVDDDDAGASGTATPAWTRVLPKVGNVDIAADANDNLVLAGEIFDPPADLGGIPVTEPGMFVAKFDQEGQPLWARPLGNWNVFSIAVDAVQNVFVVGRSPHHIWGAPPPNPEWDAIYLAKFSPQGELLWDRTMGGTLVAIVGSLHLVIDNAGHLLLECVFEGELDLGEGTVLASKDIEHADLVLARFDPAGALLQALHFDGMDYGGYREGHVAPHPSGHVILSGALNDSVDLGGVMLPAGSVSTAFVAEVDTNGAALWGKSFPSQEGWQGDIRGAATPAGDVIVAGTFDGPADFGAGPLPFEGTDSPFVIRLDGSGNYVDGRGYPGAGATVQDLVAGPAGELALSGWLSSGTLDFGGGPVTSPGGDRDAFVVKLDKAGDHALTFRAAGIGKQEGQAVAFSSSGRLYAAVTYDWSLEVNGQVVVEFVEPPPNEWPASGTLLAAFPP